MEIKKEGLKTIVVVSGKGNIGKSFTLSSLGRQLVTAGANTTADITKKEYHADFIYQNKKVGVQTYGDLAHLVINGLQEFLSVGTEIIAIASKGYGATVKAIEDFASLNNYRVIWTSPYQAWDSITDENRIKEYTASHLKLIIDDVIAGNI